MTERFMEIVGRFLAKDPPLLHKRESYGHECLRSCQACDYEQMREEALEAFLQEKLKATGDRE